MRILAISPHPDDFEIGCGGTLLKYARRGADITALILTDGSSVLRYEASSGSVTTATDLGANAAPTDLDVAANGSFFLIVGTDDTSIYESSWGLRSGGAERYGTKASFRCGTTTKVVTSTCP